MNNPTVLFFNDFVPACITSQKLSRGKSVKRARKAQRVARRINRK